MKNITIPIACSILLLSMPVQAMDDPEMDKIDMSPEVRVQPRAGIDKALLVEKTATVTAVDMENHLVTIQGADGDLAVIEVTDQVKNLPQVKIGDEVNTKYYRSAVVDLVKTKGDVELGTEVRGAKVSAPAGEKPAGMIGTEVKRTVEVVFVDPYQKFISFRGPDIGLRKVTLQNRPDLQHYLDELKKGDIVEVTYTDAMAISLEPAN